MNKKEILGWLLMLVGTANTIVTIYLIKNTLFGLLSILGIAVPCFILGSVLNKTAPDFIMNRVNEER